MVEIKRVNDPDERKRYQAGAPRSDDRIGWEDNWLWRVSNRRK